MEKAVAWFHIVISPSRPPFALNSENSTFGADVLEE
jgi:hypothetical protein